MTPFLTVFFILITLVAVLYNRLVQDRNRVDAAWSDIDVQLQRRHDLIPQLVKAVDQYAGYEKRTYRYLGDKAVDHEGTAGGYEEA